jgi:hypothetical protein
MATLSSLITTASALKLTFSQESDAIRVPCSRANRHIQFERTATLIQSSARSQRCSVATGTAAGASPAVARGRRRRRGVLPLLSNEQQEQIAAIMNLVIYTIFLSNKSWKSK